MQSIKQHFFTKYPVDVREDNSYIYDLLSLLIIIAAFAFLYRLMQQSRLQQLKHIRAASKAENDAEK